MQFRILGPLEIHDGIREITPSAPKLRQVLSLLVVRHNHPVQTAELVDELWGQSPPVSALATLQTYIHSLRKLFSESFAQILVTRTHGYQLQVPGDACDHCRFHSLARRGFDAVAEGQAPYAVRLLRDALAERRGPTLTDVYTGSVLSAQVTRLEEEWFRVLELRLEVEIGLGRHRDLLGELMELAEEYPLHENIYYKLILVLYRSGRLYEALGTYRRLRSTLVDELGLEPSASLRKLHQSILVSDPALDLDAEVTAAPYHVEEANDPPAQLPPDIGEFVGRLEMLTRLEQCLLPSRAANPALPIVAITGMPGVGKTTLAVRVAHRIRSHFPDGNLYVDLAGKRGNQTLPEEVLGDFLRVLGVPPSELPSTLAGRSKLFRTWTNCKRMLVVLDDADSAAQVEHLLPGSAQCAVIITGVPGSLPGAHTIPLEVLDQGDAIELLASFAGQPRVESSLTAAADIVEMCGRLPLAIRAAGARLAARPRWPLDEFVQLLCRRRRLDVLRFAELDLRRSLAPCYERLTDLEKLAFRALSLQSPKGLCVNQLASAIGEDVETVQAILGRLAESNLIQIHACDQDYSMRYEVCEVVHAYAQEQFERGAPSSMIPQSS